MVSIKRRRRPYNPKMAYRLALLAAEAYQSRPVLKAKYGHKFYAFINGESQGRFGLRIADTEVFILKYKKGRYTHTVVAFRGTESLLKVPADWLTNLDKSQATAEWLTIPDDEQPYMHRGFLRAYEIIRPELIDAVKDIQPRHIYMTGHSLGGALATLAALDIRMQFPPICVTMYSFGSPRVGESVFARIYNYMVPDSYRIVHDGDRAPEQLHEDFQHIGHQHTLDRHPDSKYPHHKCEYYLDQLDKELS